MDSAPAPGSFSAFAQSARPDIEATLDRLLPPENDPPGRLHEAMRYAVFAGGKRVRPVLTLLAGESLGARRDALLAPAAALEMIHTYSLVHDDLPALDDDDLRRGRPTVHRAFDEATAILTGDALLTLGLTVLSQEPAGAAPATRRAAVELVALAIGTAGMIGGQMDDLEAERAWPDDPERLLDRIHRLKTGALLTTSLRLGGLHAGADRATDDLLRQLGERLGLMFQVGDDILDVEGTDASLGKTAGKDAARDKLTFPALYGLSGSRRRLDDLRRESEDLASRLPGPARWRALVAYLADRQS